MTRDNDDGRYQKTWIQGLLFIGAPLYLYANLFVFPNIPFYLDGDQVYFWSYALRMFHGEHIYRDFFQFTPPGTDLFLLGLFKLFGPRLWVLNAAVLLLGTALCWTCYSIAKRLMNREIAVLATMFWLVLVYGRLLDATHHWFSLLAALLAVRIVMPARTPPKILAAGALMALASFFTQTAGVAGLAALLISVSWEGYCFKRPWRIILGYDLLAAAAFGVVVSGLSTYLAAEIGWKQLWYFQVTYPQHYLFFRHQSFFPGLSGYLSWRAWHNVVPRLFIYILLPVVYPLMLLRCWRERGNPAFKNGTQLVLLAFLGLFLWLEIITRVNWTRLFIISAPALILLPCLATGRGRLPRYISAAAWVIIACLAVTQMRSRHHEYHRIAQLPAGKAALSDQKYEKFSSLMRYTHPGDLFFQAQWMNVYPPLDLRSPAFVDMLFTNEVSRPEYVALTIRQLENSRVKYILWTPSLDKPDDPRRPWTDHLGAFRDYLQNHYTRVQTYSDQDELWQRQ